MEVDLNFLADLMLGLGALAVGAYCFTLSARLKQFSNLESDIGSAVAMLSAQVDDMTRALDIAGKTASTSVDKLAHLSGRAEAASARLEVLVSAMHDLPASRQDGEGSPILRFTRRRPNRGAPATGVLE